jgi:hypothetical protein
MNIWSGFTTNNHLNSIMRDTPIAYTDYKKTELRSELIALVGFDNNKVPMYELISAWVNNVASLKPKESNKIRLLMETSNQNEYLLLLQLVKRLIKN